MRSAGGAHRGLSLWLMQRISALWMAIGLPLFLVHAWRHAPFDHAGWTGLFAPLAVRIGGLLFVLALLVHAWIGMREILIDYVHAMAIRLPLYFLLAVLHAGCLVWAVEIFWSVR